MSKNDMAPCERCEDRALHGVCGLCPRCGKPAAGPATYHSVEPTEKVEYELAGYEGTSGLYYSKLAAVANGEQAVEPVYRVKK